jgi:hypothetical protein
VIDAVAEARFVEALVPLPVALHDRSFSVQPCGRVDSVTV